MCNMKLWPCRNQWQISLHFTKSMPACPVPWLTLLSSKLNPEPTGTCRAVDVCYTFLIIRNKKKKIKKKWDQVFIARKIFSFNKLLFNIACFWLFFLLSTILVVHIQNWFMQCLILLKSFLFLFLFFLFFIPFYSYSSYFYIDFVFKITAKPTSLILKTSDPGCQP